MTDTILVTGAEGFIGRQLLAALRARGLSGIALSRAASTSTAIEETLAALRPRAVLHLAGRREAPGLGALYEANLHLGLRLLEAASRRPTPPKVVLIGSAAEYGPVGLTDMPVTETQPCRPDTAYGQTKLAQTLAGEAAVVFGLPVLTARLFNVVGPGMPPTLALGRFAREIARFGPEGGRLVTGALDVSRDFSHVSDVADVLIDLALGPAGADTVLNVCSGRALSLASLLEALVARAGVPVNVEIDPDRAARHGPVVHYGSAARLAAFGLSLPARSPEDLTEGLLDARD